MTELLTWENVLRYVLYLGAMFVLYGVGICIGASVKWFREHVLSYTPEADAAPEPSEPPIPTSAH